LSENLYKGGPGDKSAPNDVNTDAWFQNLSEHSKERAQDPNSILSQAKNKDTFFCSIPFTQVYSEINGNYQACCFGADSKVSVENVSLKEWMEESEYMNSIRREMLDPNSDLKAVDSICTRCRDDERRYGRSRRTNCLKMHTNDPEFWDDIQKSAEMFKATDMWAFEDRICEIQLKVFGSECNLDCYMCMHANSTTRQQAAIKGDVWSDEIFGRLDNKRKEYFKDVTRDRTKGSVDQVIELAPYTRSVKIIGGEPLIMKKQYEMLDALIECGEAKNIRIKYQTNLSKMQAGKHRFVDYIPHFKNIAMVASVDCIGKYNDYMRRKSFWSEIEENINILQPYDNVVVDFNGLVSFLSVMRFYEVVDYVKDNPAIHQLNWAMLERPKHLRVNNLPQPIKDKLIPKYKDWPDVVAALEMPPEPDIDIQDVFDYLLKQDEHYRGTKYEMHLFETFPELEEFYVRRNDPNPDQELRFAMWEKQEAEAISGDIL